MNDHIGVTCESRYVVQTARVVHKGRKEYAKEGAQATGTHCGRSQSGQDGDRHEEQQDSIKAFPTAGCLLDWLHLA